MTDKITGETLIAWGFKPGPWFKEAIEFGNTVLGKYPLDEIREFISNNYKPREPELDPALQLRTNSIPFGIFLEAETDDEVVNYAGVVRQMDELVRTPTVMHAAVMPDACPAAGVIPVGGVVATKDAIHPGFHSEDACCSMAITVFKRDMDVSRVLDVAMQTTHFGNQPRQQLAAYGRDTQFAGLIDRLPENRFTAGLEDRAIGQFMTQGDGNHFFFVGHLKSTGQLAIVTHHGSRGFGAEVYRRGKAVAEKHTSIVSPRTPKAAAWIDANSQEGHDYWEALQLVREWTKLNHYAIHDAMQQRLGNAIVGRFWNEHNFVFRRADGLFYHAKGSTPSYYGYANDDCGQMLIPLNMGQPILITMPNDRRPIDGLGFAPHGAGRNLSRTAHMKRLLEEFPSDARGISPRDLQTIIDRETQGLDVRFYCGKPDISELPSAYKRPDEVRRQITKFDLATIVDEVIPAGTIMAGEGHKPWLKKKDRK
jgi:RNA-splicing ligase RtcB